jgi:hypothetical protein
MASLVTYGRLWAVNAAPSLHDEAWLPVQRELKRGPTLFLIMNNICKLNLVRHRHLWGCFVRPGRVLHVHVGKGGDSQVSELVQE